MKNALFLLIFVEVCCFSWINCEDTEELISRSTIDERNNRIQSRKSNHVDLDDYTVVDPLAENRVTSTEFTSNYSSSVPFTLESCDDCPVRRNIINHAVHEYWRNNLKVSINCACQQLKLTKSDGFSQAIIYSLSSEKKSQFHYMKGIVNHLQISNPPWLQRWSILAPIAVGKLEVDADSTFLNYNPDVNDIAGYLLSMQNNQSIYTELAETGKIVWKSIQANSNSEVLVSFPNMDWNSLMQGLSSTAIYEFQGWAKTTTYVKSNAMYLVYCKGSHTVYIRNHNVTQLLVADVYKSRQIEASIKLRIGLVGIILPLRGVAQVAFSCEITPLAMDESKTIRMYSARNLPDIVKLSPQLVISSLMDEDKSVYSTMLKSKEWNEKGVLISSVFSVPIHNMWTNSISLTFQIQKPIGEKGDFLVREIGKEEFYNEDLLNRESCWIRGDDKLFEKERKETATSRNQEGLNRLKTSKPSETTSVVQPGQTLSVSLQLIQTFKDGKVDSQPNPLFLSCRANRVFTLTAVPSVGNPVSVPIEFKCRDSNQSFHISFMDHDGTVAQAAVLYPLFNNLAEVNSESKKNPIVESSLLGESKCNDLLLVNKNRGASVRKDECMASIDSSCENRQETICNPALFDRFYPTFPVLMTLHGSGISSLQHADVYKMKPSKSTKSSLDNDPYIFGVKGYWVVAPTRFGAHNWESIADNTIKSSVMALRHLMKLLNYRLQYHLAEYARNQWKDGMVPMPDLRLPQVDSQSGGVISGHSMGGHGAWVEAINHPSKYVCAIPVAGWIRKEEYSNSNAFFNLDPQNSYTDPILKMLLEVSMSESHVDRLVQNLYLMTKVHIRVGVSDMTTHPWYSRRMFRVLQHHHVNVTLEEVKGKEHWWWDTKTDNDGGVLNDLTMRQLYSNCLQTSADEYLFDKIYLKYTLERSTTGLLSTETVNDYEQFRHWLLNQVDGPLGSCLDHRNHTMRPSVGEGSRKDRWSRYWMSNKCANNFTMVVVNPAIHSGQCGIRLIQQVHSLMPSRIQIQCSVDEKQQSPPRRRCGIVTHNVNRLRVQFNVKSVLYSVSSLMMDGFNISLTSEDMAGMSICWTYGKPERCSQSIDVLHEKSLRSYGPIRHVYNAPFVIVYGTPTEKSLRSSMLHFANYVANSHFAAHGTRVQIISDLDFLASSLMKVEPLVNIIFIGGPYDNKLLLMALRNQDIGKGTEDASSQQEGMVGKIPTSIQFHNPVKLGLKIVRDIDVNDLVNGDVKGFQFGELQYQDDDDGILFTLPLASLIDYYSLQGRRKDGDELPTGAMGVCIHSNSVAGYHHLSRLAWPVVPPMMRAPFVNYIPDYMVINSKVWSEGFGGVLQAGYWDNHWNIDQKLHFIKSKGLPVTRS